MGISNIPPLSGELLNVIIETPRNSNCKYAYNPEFEVFYVKKMMPLGMGFPFDFGFLPGTLAEDGDPLDVLVITEAQLYPGTMLQCRPIGILQVHQQEKGSRKKVRNDRVVAIAENSILYAGITTLKQLNPKLPAEIVNFFTDYNARQGKIFTSLGWRGPGDAIRAIRKATIA